MKKYFLLCAMIITGYLNAQKNFNTDNVEINLANNVNTYNLQIERDLSSAKDSVYLVKFTTYKFISKKKVIKKDSIVINQKEIFPIQDILLNIDNQAFNRKTIPCLDGFTVSINYFDDNYNNTVTQRFFCINSVDEVYKSILKIYSFFPFKEESL
ncbi:hypothetical protein [Empedobacter brevis]|uniref:hypothetical protein n=1 Tax=Empedobacter brevis TaxID=247 RepID=UPI0033412023